MVLQWSHSASEVRYATVGVEHQHARPPREGQQRTHHTTARRGRQPRDMAKAAAVENRGRNWPKGQGM